VSQNVSVCDIYQNLRDLCLTCTVGHPFDTIKVRLQTTGSFNSPLHCVRETILREGVNGLYKGVTPPLVGWMLMDSVMLGSLAFYRKLLQKTIFATQPMGISQLPSNTLTSATSRRDGQNLSLIGHGLAGILAGTTVSFVAAPVEQIKARLQVQYSPNKQERFYTSPIDCLNKIYQSHGFRGWYHGLTATLIFRSFFFFWWSSYEGFTRLLVQHTNLSTPVINFWAGGLSAQIFWLTSYPSDVVKQRVMTDALGGSLGDGTRKYYNWRSAAVAVYRKGGIKGYWRGFLPCFLRAFPANAMAIMVFEGVMRALH
jgi:solute carrier family 25 carnitine/acylcarnitine transporter 20/29